MSKIIAIHSFRGGTGKSNTSANLAATFAMRGLRVGVVDTDIQSPGIHVLLGLNDDELHPTLNDYLWGRCSIAEAAHDVTDRLGASLTGRVFLIPSSMAADDIRRILEERFDPGVLGDGLVEIVETLDLDVLVVDTHPGMNEETLLSFAVANVLVIVMRPDQQDYQGTAVTVDIARGLEVPSMLLVVNKVPSLFNPAEVKARVEQAYACEVAAVLPHSDELMVLASQGVFVVKYPDHPLTVQIGQLAARIVG